MFTKLRLFSCLTLTGFLLLTGCAEPDVAESTTTEPAATVESYTRSDPTAFDGDFNPNETEIGMEVGQLAPEIEGKDLDGVPFKLSDYRGKVVMLDFYGDW